MFAKDIIIGEKKAVMDEKARFTVPMFSGREKGEELLFVYSYDNDCIEIYSYTHYLEIVKSVAESKDLDYIIEHANTIPAMKELLQRALFKGVVDDQGRIGTSMDSLEKYGYVPGSDIYLIGRVDHLEMYPNKEAYTNMLLRRKLLRKDSLKRG